MIGGVAAVIQARQGSQRLPGKVLADLQGRSILSWVVDACRAASTIDETVLAVPFGDHALIAAASSLDVPVVTGPEDNLLLRYQEAARHTRAQAIVRVTADCPLLDATVIDRCVAEFLAEPVDYQEARGYPRGCGDADLILVRSLLSIDAEAASPHQQEHVGPWFLDAAHARTTRIHEAPPAVRRPDLRVCVDEAPDLAVVRALAERLHGEPPTVEKVIALLDDDPDLRQINAHVKQRS